MGIAAEEHLRDLTAAETYYRRASEVLGSLAPLARGPRLRSPRAGAGAHPATAGLAVFLGVLAVSWVGGAAMADESSTAALGALMRRGWAAPGHAA